MNKCVVCGRFTRNPAYRGGTRVMGVISSKPEAVCNKHKQADVGNGFCAAVSTNGYHCTLIHDHKGPHVAHGDPLDAYEVWK